MEHGKKKPMMAEGGMMEEDMPKMQEGGMTSEKPELTQPQKDAEGAPPIDEKKKAQVMKMLDGLKEMPPEDQLVGMIAKAVRVSEDEARMIVDEYKASKKMGMGGTMDMSYEGGGMMKMMRDPRDMVGMTGKGGAKIIS